MPEDMSEYMPEDMSDRMPEDMSEYMPEDMPDRMPEDMPDRMPEDMPDRMPEDMSDRVPEDMPDRMPEDLPDRMPEDMPEDMPDHMPEDMPDRMSNRMSEDMSDRMPEDLPVRKCINVMVGITRSKVIWILSLTMSGALMDTAIAAVDKKQLVALDAPSCGHTECSDPIPYGTFTTEACRLLSKGIKSIQLLFDVHLNIPSCGDAAQLGELVAKGKHADLPAAIAFKVPLPTASKVDLLYYDLGGGQVSILKVLYLPRPVTFQAANSMCSGDAFVEERMVEEGVAHMTECENVQQYIQQVNDKLQDKLLFRHSQASPCFSGLIYWRWRFSKGLCPSACAKDRHTTLRSSPWKLRDPRPSSTCKNFCTWRCGDTDWGCRDGCTRKFPEFQASAQDAEMALQEASQSPPDAEEVDFEADAEAATFMHGWPFGRFIFLIHWYVDSMQQPLFVQYRLHNLCALAGKKMSCHPSNMCNTCLLNIVLHACTYTFICNSLCVRECFWLQTVANDCELFAVEIFVSSRSSRTIYHQLIL